MTGTERCEECGVRDALGRHGATCRYALRIGLPRLAEDEAPIAPGEPGIEPLDAEELDVDVAEALADPAASSAAAWEADVPVTPPPLVGVHHGDVTSLWFSYLPDFSDMIVFESELEALRHAVRSGEKVHRLELGRSLRKQASEDAS